MANARPELAGRFDRYVDTRRNTQDETEVLAPMSLLKLSRDAVRRQITMTVRAVFHDPQTPAVVPSGDGLFEPGTPIRRVHADVVAMLVGGITALMMQTLHPSALRGVLDHSDFRQDLQGRLRRTARFIAVTTFGSREATEAAIRSVNAIHAGVKGNLPGGGSYSALDPRTLAWVHLAEATSFLNAYRRYAEPDMSRADQDRYFAQFAQIARRLGADPVPESCREAHALLDEMRVDLRGSAEARDTTALVLKGTGELRSRLLHRQLGLAAIDMLPPFARQMLELGGPDIGRFPAIAGTQVLAETVRWAFRSDDARS